jgi:hypothetical protein
MIRRNLLIRLAAVLATVAASRAAVPVGAVEVAGVHPARAADLVVLAGGFDAGLRSGMVCRVTRGAKEIAEVLLVDLRPRCSTALILGVASGHSIQPGDLARIKVLKT